MNTDVVNSGLGAIQLESGHTINDIIGNFINNSANMYGAGAIYNPGVINNIKADFIGNYIKQKNGGAITNIAESNSSAKIGNIDGNFIGNGYNETYHGGAIANIANSNSRAEIENINGNFISNNVNYYTSVKGGAIYNNSYYDNNQTITGLAKIGTISGNFINNSATIVYYWSNAAGGAIYNDGEINKIIGEFINNSVNTYGGGGGAIYNTNKGVIKSIAGDFISNYVLGSNTSYGGAIYNLSSEGIEEISGNFIGNHTIGSTFNSNGGAIANYGSISGANYTAKIGSIKGNFIDNYAHSDCYYTDTDYGAHGGAIYNGKDISNSTYKAIIESISGNFINNHAQSDINYANGGAIYNSDEITNGIINSNFIGNYVKSLEKNTAKGGAIYTNKDLDIVADNGISEFTGNYVQTGDNKESQAIYAEALSPYKIGYTSNYNTSIYNNDNKFYTHQNEVELRKYTQSQSDIALNFIAKNKGTIILNDKVIGSTGGETEINTLPFIVKDNRKIYLKASPDNAESEYYYINNSTNYYMVEADPEDYTYAKKGYNPYKASINFNGDSSGTVMVNNNIEGRTEDGNLSDLNLDLYLVTLHLGKRDNVLDGNNLNLNSGTFNMINNQVGISALNSLTVKGDTKFVGDVDLKSETMDRFTAKTYGQHSGNLNVVGMNVLSDMQEGKNKIEIPFAEIGLKNKVVVNGNVSNKLNLPDSKSQLTAYTPIYKYTIGYDNRDDMGYFVFTRGGKNSSNKSDAFNPAVLSSPVNIQAASNAAMNETFKYVFEHSDAFTQLPAMDRLGMIKQNQYAISTDFNQNLGYITNEFNNKAGWFRPYVTFENIDLKNGPKVDAITYGSLVGFDSDFQNFKHGWTGITTGYIGYNGSQLSYSGVDTTMNGGLLGVTQTLYKGNFWTALTLSAGASIGESTTMYGKEDFTSLLAGVGSKTGYNFEFKEGKYIIQPIMFMSYTFVNTFDYTNAAGVKINNDPMHSIMLNPSVRFITNTKNGWQPYLSVGMVWNIMNETNVVANNVKLPEMKMKPYVEYGLGIQKRFKDNFTAFGQAMIRNGGRNGIAITTGLRWNIGKSKNIEKVQQDSEKKVLKQNNNV